MTFLTMPGKTQLAVPGDAPAASMIHLIGGEKGGVGKSLVARLLAQYFIDRRIAFTGFDTDRSIDEADSSFWAASHAASSEGPKLGLLERQRLKLWLAHATAEIEAAGP